MTITGVKYGKCAKCECNALLLPKNKGLCLTCVNGEAKVYSTPKDYTLFRYKANAFAANAHTGQVRKYTGEPRQSKRFCQ